MSSCFHVLHDVSQSRLWSVTTRAIPNHIVCLLTHLPTHLGPGPLRVTRVANVLGDAVRLTGPGGGATRRRLLRGALQPEQLALGVVELALQQLHRAVVLVLHRPHLLLQTHSDAKTSALLQVLACQFYSKGPCPQTSTKCGTILQATLSTSVSRTVE